MNTPLRFGIFLPPMHPVGQNPTLTLQRDLELVEHLDRLGFDEAWIFGLVAERLTKFVDGYGKHFVRYELLFPHTVDYLFL